MSRIKELSQILDDMIEAGNDMIEAAESLKAYFSSPAKDADEAAEPELTQDPETELTHVNNEAPPLTKEYVRKLLVEKSDQDSGRYKPKVKALVRKYSENGNLSTVDPERYGALTAELEVIGNA